MTEYEYDLEGDYGFGHGWEVLTTEETSKDARIRLHEYEENDNQMKRLRIRRREVRKVVQAS